MSTPLTKGKVQLLATERLVSAYSFFFFPFLLENWDALIPLSILLAFCIDSADSQDRSILYDNKFYNDFCFKS